MGLVWGSRSAAVAASGVRRSIKSALTMPQHMWPFTMKATPPNIVLSVNSPLRAMIARMRSANPKSYAIPLSLTLAHANGFSSAFGSVKVVTTLGGM